MGVKFGPEKATTLNTFSAMKTGFKNIDNDGNIGPIPSQKAQKRVVLGLNIQMIGNKET